MNSCFRRASVVCFLPIMTVALATPVLAGNWVRGGAFDTERGVGVSFMRFLAGDGEGQMTIRCDDDRGLWVDIGAAGGGVLPEGAETGALISASLQFIGGDEVVREDVTGELLVRGDGAVLVTVIGEDATKLGPLYLHGFDRVDITIGDETRPVPLGAAVETIASLADGCDAWPRD